MANPYFKFKQFTIYQDKCAMKVGTDGVLLGAWADLQQTGHVLDVGTGTGLIALMIAQRGVCSIDAIDIDEDAFCQATGNVADSPFKGNIRLYLSSYKEYVTNCTCQYDLIISNPPYFSSSLKGPDIQRNLARHNDSLPLHELISNSLPLLHPDGRIALILPIQQEKELNRLVLQYGLSPIRKTYIITTPGHTPKRFLIEIGKREKEEYQENILTIERSRHNYTEEYYLLTKDFYLNM